MTVYTDVLLFKADSTVLIYYFPFTFAVLLTLMLTKELSRQTFPHITCLESTHATHT